MKSQETPIVVIGSGLAGLLTARLLAEKQPVVLVTKGSLFDSNTNWSQGGIAAVWSEKDSVALHTQDTVKAGDGLCNKAAVSVLSENSRRAIEQLVQLGIRFDTDDNNEFLLGLEGAHSVNRVLHAGGDATGAELQRALVQATSGHPNVSLWEHALVNKIEVQEGRVVGIQYLDISSKTITHLECEQVVIATGGAGQLFQYTSNPAGATGDGVVLAYQAGATLLDLEFYQFHPTALSLPNTPNFLISEALRGEGALLRNTENLRFMESVHPQKDLAPRDIVSRAIFKEMQRSPTNKVYLDATHLDADLLTKRFPTIFNTCLRYGVDIRKEPIPITPVAHYMIGGIATNLWGQTSVPGLYACGEVACTGVHGANRLASNSLLEASVFAMRVVQAIQKKRHFESLPNASKVQSPQAHSRGPEKESLSLEAFQKLMWEHLGIIRSQQSLEHLIQSLDSVSFPDAALVNRESFELESMKVLGYLMAQCAHQRKESRGAHYMIYS